MTSILAPAKVNLTLEVGAPQTDGYHPLRSVFLRLGLADRLTAAPATHGSSDSLVVEGPAECPVDDNLVLRAVAALRRRSGQAMPFLRFELVKRIPLGAGLGGGSSDAAAAIALAETCWALGISPDERLGLALELGSDVPFFAAEAAAALVEGRGEKVSALPAPVDARGGLLLAVAPAPMSTAAVFARHDELAAGGDGAGTSPTDELAHDLAGGMTWPALCAWSHRLHDANNLWPAAKSLMPALGRLREALERSTGRPWLLTGSGSALYCLFEEKQAAVEAGRDVAAALPAAFAGTTLLVDNLQTPEGVWRKGI